ncbi:hypothetical protein A3J91_00395 [Candidatus Peribacteria bacterium RIFOXYC2_FULL_58_10]|nr:MAG: hypothetical protein A3J91_00395 [Candidatus Peribacteria bacterium RIFOXYC2_FULL_58_10]OGJ83786.1 MAG: hypothetical protein A2529_05575 [Candidatus Peribacteria bacterium RIFOXYD2_FULL_58_15]
MKHLLLRAGIVSFPVVLFIFAVLAFSGVPQGSADAAGTCTKNGECGNTQTMYCDKIARTCKVKGTTGYCKRNLQCATGQICNRKSRTCMQNTCQKNADCRTILSLPSNFSCNKTTHTCQ